MFYDGNDNELTDDYVLEEFDNYVPFKEAARQIDLGWTGNYLHKQKAVGRIDRTKILYVICLAMKAAYPNTGGKKMFLHKDEIERFKREEYPKIKKRINGDWTRYCRFCRRKIEECFADECAERIEVLLFERARAQSQMGGIDELVSKTELSIQFTPEKKNGRRK